MKLQCTIMKIEWALWVRCAEGRNGIVRKNMEGETVGLQIMFKLGEV